MRPAGFCQGGVDGCNARPSGDRIVCNGTPGRAARWAVALPRPWLCRRVLSAQTFTASSISQAAQDARRDVGRLSRRADNLLRLTVADGPTRGAAAVRRFRAEQVTLARDLAAVFNGRVSEDDWLLVSPVRELDLALTMQALVIRLAPSTDEVEAAVKAPLPQIEPLAGDSADDVLLTIVLAVLGLERRVALFEQLRNDRALAVGAQGRHRRGQGRALWAGRARTRTADAGHRVARQRPGHRRKSRQRAAAQALQVADPALRALRRLDPISTRSCWRRSITTATPPRRCCARRRRFPRPDRAASSRLCGGARWRSSRPKLRQ